MHFTMPIFKVATLVRSIKDSQALQQEFVDILRDIDSKNI